MLIYLDQYRSNESKRVTHALKNGTNGGDIMQTNINAQDVMRAAVSALPDDLTTADIETVLDQAYALATQI